MNSTVLTKNATQKNKDFNIRTTLRKMAKCYQLYILIALPLLYILIFRYYPMYGVQIAFKKYIAVKGISGSPWVGLYNFEKFFRSYQFWRLIKNTLGISVYQLIAGFPFPILLAIALNSTKNAVYKKTVQTTIYIPHFISTVVMVGIIMQFLSPKLGLAANLFKVLGLQPPDFLGNPSYFQSVYVWSGIWQSAGWGTIIYLAALSSIDISLHEAAVVDGASRLKRILYVDIPGIMPTTVTLLIINTGQIMSIGFEKIYLMQNPLNLRTSEVISTYVYKIGLSASGGDFSYAGTIGLFNTIINFILIMMVNKIAKKVGETSLW